VQMLNDARMQLTTAMQPTPMSFQQLQAAIAQEGQEFRWILQTYKGHSVRFLTATRARRIWRECSWSGNWADDQSGRTTSRRWG
jgi:hypothetical protein